MVELFTHKLKPILVCVVVFLCILLIGCRSQKEINIIPSEKKSVESAVQNDSIIKMHLNQLSINNKTLINALRTGKIEGDFYSYPDTVPTILNKVFPQLIFAKMKKIGAGYSGYSRGWAYYNNIIYLVELEFNSLLKQMEYEYIPTEIDKMLALIVIFENFNESVSIKSVENNNEKFEYMNKEYNYRIFAIVSNQQEEYLVYYNNEQFEGIVKVNSDYYKAIEPSVY